MSVQLSRHHQNRRAEAGDAVDRAEILGSGAEPAAQLGDQEWSEDRRERAEAEADAVLERDPESG
jgi:vacuolar-type H+-ATPase subunit H